MQNFSDAVIGVPGEGLNTEQRRRLSIAVELAAKPDTLLFLDEPTSGLDSQSSIAIINLLKNLAESGIAIVTTIHQPSSVLFQEFDNLLLLAKGGQQVYFGPIGDNARTVLDYFERQGARPCADSENPAEYLLEIVNSTTLENSSSNLIACWGSSEERNAFMMELDEIKPADRTDMHFVRENKTRVTTQLFYTIQRVFEFHWRSPTYVWAKISLGVFAAL
jgi:ATP-binding cassette, subfamily G (WHITE), member 2, PDR